MVQANTARAIPTVEYPGAESRPRCPWVAYLALALPNLLDAWVTGLGVQRGIPEGNPLIAGALAWAGLEALWAVKLLGLVVVVALAEIARQQCRSSPVLMLWAMSGLTCAAVANNVAWLLF